MIKPSKTPLLNSYLSSLNQIVGLRVSQVDSIWSIRYQTTNIWLQQLTRLINTIVDTDVLLIDCGYQLRDFANERVHVIEWENEMEFRANSDAKITLSIYSNFNLLALDDDIKSKHLKRFKGAFETIVISNLDFN